MNEGEWSSNCMLAFKMINEFCMKYLFQSNSCCFQSSAFHTLLAFFILCLVIILGRFSSGCESEYSLKVIDDIGIALSHSSAATTSLDRVSNVAIVDVEVQADEQNEGDEEGDEGQEDQLLEQTLLFELDGELVLFLSQLVSFAFQQGITNVFHDVFSFN